MPFGHLDLCGGASALAMLAYLDPGTGSYALQMLLAGLFGGLFVLKQSWSDLKTWCAAHGLIGKTPRTGDRAPLP